MKYRHLIFILAFLPQILHAQIDRSKAPEPGPAPEIKVGEYSSFKLKNGLKVFVVENHKIPRIAYSLILDIDPFTEGENMGYSSIAGDLLGTATTTRTKDQIDEEVDFIGATLSSSSGSIYGASLKKHNEKLLELMSDILLNPVFNKEELDKIKKQYISSLADSKTDPSAISGVVEDVLLYGKEHPYGEVATEETVESVSLDMCEKYYRTYFKPNIAYLAIVGDIDLKEAKKLANKYFGDWQAGEVPSHSYPTPESPAEIKVSVVDRSVSVQSVIRVSHPVSFTLGTDDYVDARIMNMMLGGSTARLFQNLREDHGYTYGAYSSLSQDKYIGSFSASTDVRNEVTDSAVYQILHEINRIRDEKADSKEVEKVKNYMSGTFALALEQPSTVARFALNIARYDLPEDYYATYLQKIAAVTPESVQAAAQKYLKPENCHILVVGKADEIAENLAAFSKSQAVDYYDMEGNWIDPASLVRALPEGLTAEKLVETYLEAIGGRDKLETIKDMSITMDMGVQGMTLETNVFRKSPDKLMIKMAMGDMVVQQISFNGTSGKSSGIQGEQVLEGEELESFKTDALFMPELDYEGKGFTLKLLSVEKVGQEDTYKVELTDPAGGISLVYYDTESGLILKEEKNEETPEGSVLQVTLFEDYQETDGLLYPHKTILQMGPQTITSTVKKLEYNTGIEDSVFNQ